MADQTKPTESTIEKVKDEAEKLVEVVLKHKLTNANVLQPDGSVKDVVYGDDSKESVTVSVTPDIAEDLKRRDDAYEDYKQQLHDGKVVTMFAGNIDAAGK